MNDMEIDFDSGSLDGSALSENAESLLGLEVGLSSFDLGRRLFGAAGTPVKYVLRTLHETVG